MKFHALVTNYKEVTNVTYHQPKVGDEFECTINEIRGNIIHVGVNYIIGISLSDGKLVRMYPVTGYVDIISSNYVKSLLHCKMNLLINGAKLEHIGKKYEIRNETTETVVDSVEYMPIENGSVLMQTVDGELLRMVVKSISYSGDQYVMIIHIGDDIYISYGNINEYKNKERVFIYKVTDGSAIELSMYLKEKS